MKNQFMNCFAQSWWEIQVTFFHSRLSDNYDS